MARGSIEAQATFSINEDGTLTLAAINGEVLETEAAPSVPSEDDTIESFVNKGLAEAGY